MFCYSAAPLFMLVLFSGFQCVLQIKQIDVLIIGAFPINDSVLGNLNDTVCYGLYQLMVMTGENDVVWESSHSVVQCRDAFQIQMIRRLIHQEEVAAG